MTGVEINQIYSQQIGQTYSGLEDITKKNRRFKKALINAIEEKYRNLNEQREFDAVEFRPNDKYSSESIVSALRSLLFMQQTR